MKSKLLLFISCISMAIGAWAQAPLLEDLFKAVRLGDLTTVRKLLDRGLDINSTDQAGNSILVEAAREGHPRIVTLLVERKVNVNARNAVGDTAIMLAALGATWRSPGSCGPAVRRSIIRAGRRCTTAPSAATCASASS
ncbi:MAG: ankyrin repeat domain-containing protein [Burkholderiales bacterium]|nr:ankyrin repeat domain-containing protein [Burkholderiales bacterium]